MKHVKLFEEFGLQKNPNFSPEDKIQSGDTAFCWNFEDGWMVTLLGEKLSTEMMDHLEASLRNLVDEPRYSSKKGIAFVSTGIPSELSVSFEMENFDTSKFDYLVNSQGETENLADEYSGSCVFTLKRNHVIGHRWNGGQFCIPIEEYFEKYADKADELDAMVAQLANDPEMRSHDLTIDRTDPEIPLLVWNNPQDDAQWRSSGYAEDYDGNFSNVGPMNVLAFVNVDGETFAYKLTPEEKTYGEVVQFGDGYEPNQLVKLETISDLKRAFSESLWEMD
jgi:hypothetical protein